MRCIGIMTGNSLDAVDVVITDFNDNRINDVGSFSLPVPQAMAAEFRLLKQALQTAGGDIATICRQNETRFAKLHDDYIQLVAKAVNQAIKQNGFKPDDIDIIGFHGQTCAHCPPSITKENPYTLQIGSGQMLADLTGIRVAYDFRSDDLMNGGEAAPLAPVHNRHLAVSLKAKGVFPVAFCNGGNTGNISIISTTPAGIVKTLGWDTGPFNHFIDELVRREKNEPCDFNGKYGLRGTIDFDLLRELFARAAVTEKGGNFLLQTPPKSSDPAWYRLPAAATNEKISFNNRIRTLEFFSAYIFAYSLRFIPENITFPRYFLTFGGGWNNPVITADFHNILTGKAETLPEHRPVFASVCRPDITVTPSDTYGFSGRFMEARIFADMACCLLRREPFSYPETTGCRTPTIAGIIAIPGGNDNRLWSRAAFGWQNHRS